MINKNKNLENKIIAALKESQGIPMSIPLLCEKTGILDDHVISSGVENLQIKKSVVFNRFKTVYREDAGKIQLALYSIPLPTGSMS